MTVTFLSLCFVLLIVGLLLLIFCFYARYKLNYWNRRGVEQLPNADLVFGHVKDAMLFRTAPGWHMGVLHNSTINKDAPFVGFYVFHKPCLLLRDPKIIKNIMIRSFENFSDRHFGGSQQKDSMGMTNLFGLKNPAWKYLRSKLTPTLNGSRLKQMLPLLIQNAETMMKYLEEQSKNLNKHMMIDAQKLSYYYTTDATANVALGISMDSFNNPNEITEFGNVLFYGLKRKIAVLNLLYVPELLTFIGFCVLSSRSLIRKYLWNSIKNRAETSNKRGDFIDAVIDLKNGKQDPIYNMKGDNLVNLIGTFYAGFETGSNCVSFALMKLASHPEYQDKAREDIERAIKEHGLTYSGFNDMKYLDQCIYETIRIYPPVPTVDRRTKEDYKIPGTGVTIQKGTPIFVSLYGMHLDPRFFKQPEIYDPSRFAGGQTVSDAFLPFGLGPRMCPGVKLGMLYSKVILAMILREYIVTQNPGQKVVLDSRSTLTVAAGSITLQFKKIY
ncbi:cytochrome P450 6k1-like [Copidosoma floridanum]|uniref:cytochrome P450 6k1-like n=1 Tax=Copidosoma floridanum TaxID=29053 RepID=UPI000C6FC795|nr:cytochrome P450 6k1-like [Copidosoma floridanum]